MINHNIKILALGLLLLFAYGCKKDILGEGETTTVVPLPNVWVESNVIGLVQDEGGQPLSNVLVDHVGNTFMTDDNGYFTVPTRSTTVSGGYITFTKDGYFENSKFFTQFDQNYSFLKVTMLDLGTPEVIDASTASSVSVDNDVARIEFKQNSFVDESGSAYTGAVSVYSQYIDPTAADLAERMPGDLRAIDAEEARVQLSTFGMLATELRGEGGEKLQLASGSPAVIKMIIPEELKGSITPTIPVWSYDEDNGYWIEESEASLTSDGYYTAEVSHFSYWNYDAPWPIVRFCGRFTYESGEPLAHAKVTVVIVSSGACKSAWTDSEGKVGGDVPKDQPLEIVVTDECGNVVYQEEIGSYDEAFELDIVVPNTLVLVIIEGVLTCNGMPVSNGYVHITNDQLLRTVAPTDENGNFSLPLTDCNSTSRVTVQGFDIDEPAVGEIEIRDVTSDVETFMLEVCDGDSEDEYITLDISGDQRLFTEPTAKLVNGTDLILTSNTTTSPDSILEFTTIIISNAFQGANNVVSSISGATTQNGFSCDESTCAGDFTVDLTEIGNQVGDVIEGSYEGVTVGANGDNQNVSGTFRILLDELCNTANVSGRLYLDDNDNGLYDAGEEDVEGLVGLLNENGQFLSFVNTNQGEFSFDDVFTQNNYSINVRSVAYQLSGSSPVDLNCQGITMDESTLKTSQFLLEDAGVDCINIPFKRVEFDCDNAVSVLSPASTCTGAEGQLQIVNVSQQVILFNVVSIDGVEVEDLSLILEGNSIGGLQVPAGIVEYNIETEVGDILCTNTITMTSADIVDTCNVYPIIDCQGDELVYLVLEFWCNNLIIVDVQWSDGQSGDFITTVEGTYSGIFTDSAGCQGEVQFDVDFSEYRTVSGIVWEDSPSGIDGILQNGENLLANTAVRLYEEGNTTTPIDMVLTDDEGGYTFENLDLTTTYLISIDLPAGYAFSPQGVGLDNNINSRIDPVTGFATYMFECDPNLQIFNYNIGIKEL